MTVAPSKEVKPEALSAKKASTPIAEIEREQAVLRVSVDASREQLHGLQQELASSLALRRAAARLRAPLEQAATMAQRAAQEAHDALARHIGQESESVYADKLFEAQEAARNAQEALIAFDQQYTSNERNMEMRAAIQQAQEALQVLEQQQVTVARELARAIAAQQVVALSHILEAYQDLYTVLETDGQAFARMRIDDPEEYHLLMRELTFDQDTLFTMIQSDRGGVEGEDRRPILRERQQSIHNRQARLKKLAESEKSTVKVR